MYQKNLALLSQQYKELSKKPKLKMKNSGNFQERILAQKAFFHLS